MLASPDTCAQEGGILSDANYALALSTFHAGNCALLQVGKLDRSRAVEKAPVESGMIDWPEETHGLAACCVAG